MMIIEFAEKGNLRTNLSNNFNNIMWRDKIKLLYDITYDLNELHKSGYIHKDFHNGNILQINDTFSYISDFGLSGPANVHKNQMIK
jgi:serine/threonine protein kinase